MTAFEISIMTHPLRPSTHPIPSRSKLVNSTLPLPSQSYTPSMHLPYDRPRLLEFHEQPWIPDFIRQPIQTMLTAVWITRFPPFQLFAPYEAVSDTLERLVTEIEKEDALSSRSGEKTAGVMIVDCCSGAGGPMPAIERRLK